MSYFEDRALEAKKRSVILSEKYIKTSLKNNYKTALKSIDADLDSIYEKYAGAQRITLSQAMLKLSNKEGIEEIESLSSKILEERKAFEAQKDALAKSVIEDIETNLKVAEENLSLLSKKGYISHLGLMKASIENNILKLANKNQITLYEHLSRQYLDGYFRGIFNITKELGFEFDFTTPDKRAVELAIVNKWSGKNYSKRLYSNTKKLAYELKNSITNGIIRGDSIEKIAKDIAYRTEVSHYRARVIARTESAYIHEDATMKAYEEAGIEEYVYMATLDRRTSKVCSELDGKIFKLSEKEIGKNYPPMHPNCRSTTVAHIDGKVSKRLARGADGKKYEVKGDLSYKDWYESLSTTDRDSINIQTKMDMNLYTDKKQYAKFKNILGKDMPSLEKLKELKYNKDKEYELIKEKIKSIKNAKLNIEDKQFGKKFGKHGKEYNLDLKDKNSSKIYMEKINEVRNRYEIRKIGSWRGHDDEVVFYLKDKDLLITDKDGNFISLFRGGDENARFKNAREF